MGHFHREYNENIVAAFQQSFVYLTAEYITAYQFVSHNNLLFFILSLNLLFKKVQYRH